MVHITFLISALGLERGVCMPLIASLVVSSSLEGNDKKKAYGLQREFAALIFTHHLRNGSLQTAT